MAERINIMTNVFDFSLEAQAFKEQLWKKLQASTPVSFLQPLEDDDLEWVNAAGMIHCSKEKDPFP